MIRIGSLFSGIDGLALGVQLATLGRVVWHAEIDKDGAKVLAMHWRAPNLGNVTRVDWSGVEPIDVLVGGFPCQDISAAGKGVGIEGERSGLWREIVRCIRALRPQFAFVENVSALLARGFERVARDLAEVGYRFAWTSYSSAAVGAPHKRERIFILATPDGACERRAGKGVEQRERREPDASRGAHADAACPGCQGADPAQGSVEQSLQSPADTDGAGLRDEPRRSRRSSRASARVAVDDDARSAPADSHFDGRKGLATRRARAWEQPRHNADGRGAGGGMASEIPACDSAVGGDPRTACTSPRRLKLNPDFVEWIMGFPPGWTAGVSRRARLRLLGNAVQPQTAQVAFVGLRDRLGINGAAVAA